MNNTVRKLTLMAMGMAALSSGHSYYGEDRTQVKDILPKPKVKTLQKGQKVYRFGGFECYAINEKNAEKKYKRYLETKRDEGA